MSQNTSHAVMAQRSEEWRAVPSFPSYEASSFGRIRRDVLVLKQNPNEGGYLQLKVSENGKAYSRRVHTLVCEAFHGPKPSEEHEVAHGNGVRSDNAEWNVRWATYAENRADMIVHGTWPKHEAHPRAGLTEAEAAEIRRRHNVALTGRQRCRRGTRQLLSAEFGVSIHVIKDVIGNRSWIEGVAP